MRISAYIKPERRKPGIGETWQTALGKQYKIQVVGAKYCRVIDVATGEGGQMLKLTDMYPLEGSNAS